MKNKDLDILKVRDEKRPLVSIIYTVYNHRKFISEALESFIAQECSFDFEIIVHDDCSNDGSQEIIEKYKLQHPQKIVTIYQDENQWSKGTYPAYYFALKRAVGSYIAFCDGDDYWTSSQKLENQVEAMRNFSVDISGHPALCVYEKNGRQQHYTGYVVSKVSKFMPRDLIKKRCNMMPFSSMVISKKVKDDLLQNTPLVRFHTGIQVLGARRSGLCILPTAMSAYRVGVANSATTLLLGTKDLRFETGLRRLKSINRIYKLYDQDGGVQDVRRSLSLYISTLLAHALKQNSGRFTEAVSSLTDLSQTDKLIAVTGAIPRFAALLVKDYARACVKLIRNG